MNKLKRGIKYQHLSNGQYKNIMDKQWKCLTIKQQIEVCTLALDHPSWDMDLNIALYLKDSTSLN